MVLLLLLLALQAPPAEWELLGTRRVDFRLDHDVILVGARHGAYSAIKIEVGGGMLEMYNVRVTFGDGETWSPPTRLAFQQGSWTRTIDVPGPARLIRRIDFAYRSRVRRGAATVRVFGRAASLTPAESTPPALAPPVDRPAAPTPPPAPPPASAAEEWEHLACRPIDAHATRDSVVDPDDTPFRGIRFEVEGGNIELYDVKVTFANGETFAPDVHLAFNSGTRIRSVELPGEARAVRRVEYSYRVPSGVFTNSQTKTTVHVYGRR